MKTGEALREQAASRLKAHRKLLQQLSKMSSLDTDELFHTAHEQVFEETDCLQCANCCKTTSPLLLRQDIERLAAHLKMPVKKFFSDFVRTDEDNDWVFQSTPCPFLDTDNTCKVYAQRPKACREYPHTNRKKMQQILDLTLTNASICPAVLEILNRMEDGLLEG